MIKHVYVKNLEQLSDEINKGEPLMFVGSRTSTVIPYDTFTESEVGSITKLVDTSLLKKEIVIKETPKEVILVISGGVSWLDLKIFCAENDLFPLTSPTEENALVLSGIATSATGERCFGFGTLRDQVRRIKYMNFKGEIKSLDSDKAFESDINLSIFNKYKQDYQSRFKLFKNGPFPRFEKETDLMIGTEGQLGVITEAEVVVKKKVDNCFIFVQLDKWESNYDLHLEILNWVQGKRDRIYACEILDSNSLSVLPEDESPIDSRDVDLIFLEVSINDMEDIFECLVSDLPSIDENKVFSMDASRCQRLRLSVPRYTFERNSQMGVLKKGTDVQVSKECFSNLLDLYRDFSKVGISYNLFGHFGDCHLHFNFFPKKNEEPSCDELLKSFYQEVKKLSGSPFAEHGIGLFKQKFIKDFYESFHYEVFELLKKKYDPDNIFFPSGFMSMSRK